MLEHPEKPKSYVEAVLPYHLRLLAAKLWVGPSPQMRHYYRKTGKSVNFGESSLEDFAVAGSSWEDWLDLKQAETEGGELDCLLPNKHALAELLDEINNLMENVSDVGISYAKTRNKWHVECKIKKHTQFIGQFKNIESARISKCQFLTNLKDKVLEMLEESALV